MMRIILLVLLGLVAAIVLLTLLLRPEPPRLPLDRDHTRSKVESACLSCHGPGEKNARKPNHPNANDCFRCHTYKDAA